MPSTVTKQSGSLQYFKQPCSPIEVLLSCQNSVVTQYAESNVYTFLNFMKSVIWPCQNIQLCVISISVDADF